MGRAEKMLSSVQEPLRSSFPRNVPTLVAFNGCPKFVDGDDVPPCGALLWLLCDCGWFTSVKTTEAVNGKVLKFTCRGCSVYPLCGIQSSLHAYHLVFSFSASLLRGSCIGQLAGSPTDPVLYCLQVLCTERQVCIFSSVLEMSFRTMSSGHTHYSTSRRILHIISRSSSCAIAPPCR